MFCYKGIFNQLEFKPGWRESFSFAYFMNELTYRINKIFTLLRNNNLLIFRPFFINIFLFRSTTTAFLFNTIVIHFQDSVILEFI